MEIIGERDNSKIFLADYDPSWPAQYESHRATIGEALGAAAMAVHHMGSTSVPGLSAKPIIDILVVVADAANEASYVPALDAAGYALRIREPEFDEHRMLRTAGKDVHVHIWSKESDEISRHLKFRDRLRLDGADRQRYEDVKRSLAAQEFDDRNDYTEGKNKIIADIESRS
jgi:GrpB-like predicted nucleotidyltransferase (UPF0157 family)